MSLNAFFQGLRRESLQISKDEDSLDKVEVRYVFGLSDVSRYDASNWMDEVRDAYSAWYEASC